MNKATIEQKFNKVLNRISKAAMDAQRDPGSITLMAVSKTKPPQDIILAYQAGARHFGENYLQEAQHKIAALNALPITWHFIGPIQSNKTRPIAELFDWVHSVDRLKVAQRLSDQRPHELNPLQICLQVNVSNEPTKSGVALHEAEALALAIDALPNIVLRGLMAIPEPSDEFEAQQSAFLKVRGLFEQIQCHIPHIDTLSMGMSQDLEAAIAEGATIVRIGTDIFGARDRGLQASNVY
jgi:pyridoxal phosphate enzyme (YggS family)